jgi:hypothetical protein
MVLTLNAATSVSATSPDTNLCAGQSRTLTQRVLHSGGSYQWSPTTAMTPAAGNTATVSVSPAATQTYIITYTLAGCSILLLRRR